jgi:DMSO/TMAO reductase YedYZ molybdopterin-dependent catalytic subunit
MLRQKYIEAKQRWAEKQRAQGAVPRVAATTGRLPPGQTLTTGFPVLDLGVKPEVPLDQWRLTIDGLVEKPVTLDWAQFNALPQVEDVSDFHCVTSWSKYDCRWSGVAFATLCELVEPMPEAHFVYFTSFDEYSTNVPMEKCLDDDVLVATRFDGQPITREHGGPARVIIPKLYAWKGAKFVKGIAFLDEDKLGFWEVRGYSNGADPWKEERYA